MNDIKTLYRRIDKMQDLAWMEYKSKGDGYQEGRADAFQECMLEIEEMFDGVDFEEQDHD